jgi:hypothetical protein
LAESNLGQLVLPEGWSQTSWVRGQEKWTSADGTKADANPGTPEGIIAIANAIPDMGALTSLNLSSNNLKAEGGKVVAEAIKVTNNAMAVVFVPFPCPSDHWLNCCLLLSTG